jgi:hypothetical protein
MHHKIYTQTARRLFFIISNLFQQLNKKITYFRVLSVRSVTAGFAWIFCESNAENSQQKAVGCLYVNESLNCRLFLLDHRAQLVGGQVHAVKVCQANFALGFLDDELEFSERVFVLIQVAKRDLEHTSLETVRGDF